MVKVFLISLILEKKYNLPLVIFVRWSSGKTSSELFVSHGICHVIDNKS